MDTLAVAFVVANLVATLVLAFLVMTKKSGDGSLSGEVRAELRDATGVLRQDLGQQRTELHQVLESQRTTVEQRLVAIAESQHALSGSVDKRLETSAVGVAELGSSLGERHNEFSKHVSDAFEAMRLTNEAKLEAVRATVGEKLEETLEKRLELVRKTLEERLDENAKRIGELSESNAERQTELQKALGVELEKLRKDNEAKLEQVRLTVDEKLQETLRLTRFNGRVGYAASGEASAC